MKMRVAVCVCVGAMILVMAACSGSSTQPSGSASVTAPKPVVPSPNSTVPFNQQPVSLSIANALVTQSSGTAYTFEVATDSNFTNKVQTKADVAEGSNGQTSVRLDQLAGSADYYWHARASSGGTVGVFGPTYKFTVGPAIVISAATLVSPVSGAQTGSLPALTVTNAQRSGPVGQMTYRFEASTSPGFGSLLLDRTVAEGAGGRTTLNTTTEMPAETTIYWRVTASDATSGVSGPVSSTGSFVTALAIDLSKVVFLNSPNASNWKRTGTLLSVEQDGAGEGLMCTLFTDPGWPDSPWPYGEEPGKYTVFANQWYFANIGGIWYGGAGEWIYRAAASVCKSGQTTEHIGPDSGFGEPFASWRPKVGELVGYMISSVARPGVPRTVDERTNIIVQPWRDTSRGSALAAPGVTFTAPGIQ